MISNLENNVYWYSGSHLWPRLFKDSLVPVEIVTQLHWDGPEHKQDDFVAMVSGILDRHLNIIKSVPYLDPKTSGNTPLQ